MVRNIFLISFLLFISTFFVHAQDYQMDIPKVEVKNGVTYWYGISIDSIVGKSDLIFEGRILSDSAFFQNAPGEVFTCHKVLVLKKFKGDFTSDTIRVVTWGGKMIIDGQSEGTPVAYAFKGDEAVIFAINSSRIYLGGNDSTTFDPFYGPGASYITVCDKKDVVKEVYEPIEGVTGQPYIDVRPNTCKNQVKQNK